IKAPSRCRAGECGWCRSRLLSGTVFIPQENEMRRWADVNYGYIHPCCSFPTSDLTLEIPGEFF
ncbi:MAG: 2Fe-2S iron-sulfur cluster binding domain-containing protein, partial [Oscillospiraceae bacterium]|nr:2Fe-2S iron-sulfur cluster binding domain-containing protein [Oscillospiraceae bacterium]